MSTQLRTTLYILVSILATASPSMYAQYASDIQDDTYGYIVVEPYKRTVVPAEFKRIFNDSETSRNFKKLREFLWEKTDLYRALSEERTRYYYASNELVQSLDESISNLTAKVKDKQPNEKIAVDWNLFTGFPKTRFDSLPNRKFDIAVDSVKSEINRLTLRRDNFVSQIRTAAILDSNIANVRTDLYDVNKQLDSTLAPEYKNQSFRVNISTLFTILIGILLVAFFVVVYKKSDNTLARELLSGNGLQFITLFILIISVILFGILSILEGRELAAILSGISGYILGKGTQRELATAVTTAGTVAKANAANLDVNTPKAPAETQPQNDPVLPAAPLPATETPAIGMQADDEDLENADAPIPPTFNYPRN